MKTDIAIQEGRELECFTWWKSYSQVIDRCPQKARIELLTAITNYAFLGKDTTTFKCKFAEALWIGVRANVRKGRVNALNRKKKEENEPQTN